MFDYESFADKIYKDSLRYMPAQFSEVESAYVSSKVKKFATISGESLCNDKDTNFNDEAVEFITQAVAEWTFHKSIDLINGKVPVICRDEILEKIAFTIYEVAKEGLRKEIDNDSILSAIEHHVNKAYKESIDELPINEEQKDLAKRQSNMDYMVYSNSNDAYRLANIVNNFIKSEEYKEAVESYEKACFYNNIAYCYYKLDNDKKALENIEKALKIDSECQEALYTLGEIHYKNKEYNEALENFLKVLKLGECSRGFSHRPKNQIYNRIGNTYIQLNMPEKAIEYFTKENV